MKHVENNLKCRIHDEESALSKDALVRHIKISKT